MNKLFHTSEKSRIALFAFLLLLYTNAIAQSNLIPNHSFEYIDSVSLRVVSIPDAIPWTAPPVNSSDIFSENSLDTFNRPPFIGNYNHLNIIYQYPHSGKSMAGIITLMGYNGNNYREYLQAPLIDSLKSGKCYIVYFYTNNWFCYQLAINNIALSFSDTILPSNHNITSINSMIPLPSHIMKQGNPVITDTMNWTPIAGIYIAHGGEKYAEIGNFHPDSLTDTINMCNQSQWASNYFIDDVFVIEANAYAGKDTSIAKGDSVYLGIEQVPGVQNNWYVGSSLIKQNTGGIWVQPQQTTTYILQSTICNTTYYDTVTVIVSNVGINQLTNNNRQLEVYPNPANTNLTISPLANLKMIEVYDVVGRKLEDLRMSRLGNEIQIQVSDLSSGIYFLKATDEKGFQHTAKFVKE